MVQLATFEQATFPELAESKVGSIESCIIYYVTTGRNAWHSTWVQQYSNGCMHTSLSSAKSYAEKRRTQGTVFTIKEQPSLAFRTSKGDIIITQINTNTPLIDYSADALHEHPKKGTKLIEGARNNYLEKGVSAGGAALSFDWQSRFWNKPPPQKNSVILVARVDTGEGLESLKRGNLKAWSSFSNGSGYLLGWQNRENTVSSNGILSLAAQSSAKILRSALE